MGRWYPVYNHALMHAGSHEAEVDPHRLTCRRPLDREPEHHFGRRKTSLPDIRRSYRYDGRDRLHVRGA